MVDERYKHIGELPTNLIEECSELSAAANELVKLICKGERFGYLNYHPSNPSKNNIHLILEKMAAVQEEIEDFKIRANEMKSFMIDKEIEMLKEPKP